MNSAAITIPPRVMEAIEQGEQLRLHLFAGHYHASLKNADLIGFHAPQGRTMQLAIDNLNRELPQTMAEMAISSASKKERNR